MLYLAVKYTGIVECSSMMAVSRASFKCSTFAMSKYSGSSEGLVVFSHFRIMSRFGLDRSRVTGM